MCICYKQFKQKVFINKNIIDKFQLQQSSYKISPDYYYKYNLRHYIVIPFAFFFPILLISIIYTIYIHSYYFLSFYNTLFYTILQIMNIKSSKQTPSNFILKLYNILEKPEYTDILTWKLPQNYIHIKNVKSTQQIVLPLYFNHSNFTSFIRQLNMYDFHKVMGIQKSQDIYFSHQLFLKGRRDLLSSIKRKKSNNVNIKQEQVIRGEIQMGKMKLDWIKKKSEACKNIIKGIIEKTSNSRQFEKVLRILDQMIGYRDIQEESINLKIQQDYEDQKLLSNKPIISITSLTCFDSRCSLDNLCDPIKEEDHLM